jgi:CheY-like chemotaxis protein/HPt (histidine-containing phosphotransfer) domain-containing protein
MLFTSFTQVDNSTTKNYGGTGLGLVISKELAKLMNGTIGVYSTLGLGSTFWFTFETEAAEKPLEEINQNKKRFEDFNYFIDYHPNILIVDDNQINQKVASQILAKSGCEVDLANNGIEAIEKVRKHKYDLIFMDIQMPEMDGVTATREIKRLGIKNLPPIIAMTAYSMKEDREKFLNVGMDDYLAKPIKADALINKVKEWVILKIPRQERVEPETAPVDVEEEDHIINPEVIQQLLKYGDEEMVYKVFEDFILETEEQITESLESISKNDIKNLLSILHTLKGNAGTLGIEKLSNFAKLVENKLKQGEFDQIATDFQTLQIIFGDFKQSYKHHLIKTL